MKQHVLMVGLNDKDTKKQEITKEKALQTIFSIVGDSTISDAYGCFTHEDGTVVLEKSLRVEMLFKSDDEVNNFIELIKKELNQESIYLERKEVNACLV